MDTAMRDLEMIQEQTDEESPGRKAAMLGMAGLSTIGLVFAMGVALGDRGETPSEPDPLAALAPAMQASAPPETEEVEPAEDTLAPGEVRFHEQLTDDRPEVEAALAAAAAEQHLLAQTVAPTPAPAAAVPDLALPTARLDVLPMTDVARAPRAEADSPSTPRAPSGHDGAFTIQVASYRTREEAELFADALRGRGHESFVMRAELPGRGTYFRVRIGPFDSRPAADRYRSTFEREEGMNTYVVDSARVAAQAAAAGAPE